MDIVRQLAECGVMQVALTGGEALVRKDFFDIADALIENDILITAIYSNGKLVTDSFLDELEKRNIHPEISMSYDGVGWHDWLRGIDGAEKIVEDAFIRCRDRGFQTSAEMCLHKQNIHTLRESVNRLHEWGCLALKTNLISNIGAWKENGYDAQLTYDELFQLYIDYIPQYYEDKMPLQLQLGGFFAANPKESDKYVIPFEQNCADPNKVCVCSHARQVMYISAEGRALPCMALSGMDDVQRDFPIIQEAGLAACLTDSRYMKLIETKASELLEHNPECKTCEFANKCLCGCRASALETSPDDILAPDKIVCRFFKGGWPDKLRALMSEQIGIK
jgi:radical SAM protein with 4Fe4S-binding SPASM domain